MSASIIRQYHDNTEDDKKKINNQHSCEVDKKYISLLERDDLRLPIQIDS